MLKIIKGSDNPSEYLFSDFMKSAKENDEFTKYRTTKYIRKEEERAVEQLRKGVIGKESSEWN